MPSRRTFLAWSGFISMTVLAHHRPGHGGGPSTTTTTTIVPSAGVAWPATWPAVWPE